MVLWQTTDFVFSVLLQVNTAVFSMSPLLTKHHQVSGAQLPLLLEEVMARVWCTARNANVSDISDAPENQIS